VKLVAITHVPTQGGLVNPAEEVGALTREAGVPYLLDACQSVGQMPVNVERIGCDMLSRPDESSCADPEAPACSTSATTSSTSSSPVPRLAHAATWTAPDSYEIRPDARRFENWETNYAAKIGLGVAVDYALSWGLDAIEARVTVLALRLRHLLTSADGVHVHDQGQRRCGIVTFTVGGVPAQTIQQQLSDRGVNVSVSLVDYARLDLPARDLPDLVRASVHYYNTDEEIDQLRNAVPPPTEADPTLSSRISTPPHGSAKRAIGSIPERSKTMIVLIPLLLALLRRTRRTARIERRDSTHLPGPVEPCPALSTGTQPAPTVASYLDAA
jgi:cysteine desulfurase / selenocysteine lyase